MTYLIKDGSEGFAWQASICLLQDFLSRTPDKKLGSSHTRKNSTATRDVLGLQERG